MLKRILTLALALMLCACALAEAPVLTVQGTAAVSLNADTATITLGIRRYDSDVKTVQSAVNQRMDAVITALLDAGVEKKDVYTSSISIYPEYDYDGYSASPELYREDDEDDEDEEDKDEEDKDEDARIKGYNASNTITIVTSDIDNVGTFIDAAFDAGANTLDDVSFSASDTTEASNQALRLAVENARAKAEIMADAAGMALGAIVSVTEGETYNYGASYLFAKNTAAVEDAGTGTQVIASRQTVNANVTLQFQLLEK